MADIGSPLYRNYGARNSMFPLATRTGPATPVIGEHQPVNTASRTVFCVYRTKGTNNNPHNILRPFAARRIWTGEHVLVAAA